MNEKKKEIRFIANMITAQVNGMYSTHDLTELVAMYGDAKLYLDKMFKMIYHDRFETESEE